ncbi:hypothetical protein IE81DRAFT_332658 [Ceraceosorus guamensis]|uniref:Secreted protein n=1 Tax=Ceraceosorus guamensis TaxID=1522189 RepID=A0A316VNT5_9BASI|nr:hypothetical protein IE81DRAFT_332658 [Ceraceosorus guamensis]PWN38974.1 hypothetical protein IE81DRAFT_332658 [Ceraceosorus guamensis]
MNILSKLILCALLSAPLAAIAGRDNGGAHDHGGDLPGGWGEEEDKYNRVTVIHHPAALNDDAQKVAFGNACGHVGGADAQWDYVLNSAGGHDGWCHIPGEDGGGGADYGFDVGAALGNESPEWKLGYYWYSWPPTTAATAAVVKRSPDSGSSVWGGGPQREQYLRIHPKQWPSWMTVEDQKAAWGKECKGLSGGHANWDLEKAHGGKAAWCHIPGGKDFGGYMMENLPAQDPAWAFDWRWESWPPA